MQVTTLKHVASGLLHFCNSNTFMDEFGNCVDALFMVLAEAPAKVVPALAVQDIEHLFVKMGKSMCHLAAGHLSERTQVSTLLSMAVIASVDCPGTAAVSGSLAQGEAGLGGFINHPERPAMLGFSVFMECLHCESIILAQEHTAMHGFCAMMCVRWRFAEWALLRRLAWGCGINISTALGSEDAARTTISRDARIQLANDLYMQLWIEYEGESAQPGTEPWDTHGTRRWRRFAALCIQAAVDGVWGDSEPTDAHDDQREEVEAPFNCDTSGVKSDTLRAVLQTHVWADRRHMVVHRRLREIEA